MNLWDCLKKEMLKNRRQIISESDAQLTYEEMVMLAQVHADELAGEKCCAIYCKSELMTAMGLLACFAAQVTAVPISYRYGKQHCGQILEMISPSCIMTDINGKLEVIRVSDFRYLQPKDHPALIMCTSGSTGTPKGVMLGAKGLLANAKDILKYFNLSERDTVLIARPLYHCAVLTGEFIVSLLAGCKIVFSSSSFNPIEMRKLLKDEKITTFCGTPTMFNVLSQFFCREVSMTKQDVSCKTKKIVVSGECLSRAVAEKIRRCFPLASVYHVYGLTEASPRVSFLPAAFFDDDPECVGLPLESVRIRIQKDDRFDNGNGEGIIWVSGPNLMLGYYNNASMTGEVLKDGWLCTGDVGHLDEKGFLHVIGRSDDMMIRAGMNIYPKQIEYELLKDPRTKEVVAYGRKNKYNSADICMRISGDFRDANEVKMMCLERLPAYCVPSKIELMDQLPKGPSGKVKRGEL